MSRRWLHCVGLACITACLHAGDLAAPTVARILRVVAASGGSNGKIACHDAEVVAELGRLGVAVDPGARILWTNTEREVVQGAAQGRLVVCGNVSLLAKGAAVAVTAEGGRPAFHVSLSNAASSGLTLPDGILKIAQVTK